MYQQLLIKGVLYCLSLLSDIVLQGLIKLPLHKHSDFLLVLLVKQDLIDFATIETKSREANGANNDAIQSSVLPILIVLFYQLLVSQGVCNQPAKVHPLGQQDQA
jgi:hypothetical protein